MAFRQDVLIFWKPGNFMAEMQGCHALKQFVRKGVSHFHEFHTPGVLVGLSFAVNLKMWSVPGSAQSADGCAIC